MGTYGSFPLSVMKLPRPVTLSLSLNYLTGFCEDKIWGKEQVRAIYAALNSWEERQEIRKSGLDVAVP